MKLFELFKDRFFVPFAVIFVTSFMALGVALLFRSQYPEIQELDLTKRKLESLNVEFAGLKENVNRLTTDELEQRLRESEAKINSLSSQLQSLQQIISPGNASEILTVARMKEEILARREFEGKLDERLKQFQDQINRTDDRLDSTRNAMWAIVITLLGGLVGVTIYLMRRFARIVDLIERGLIQTPGPTAGSQSPAQT
jgi:hypothetical protein